MYLRTLDSGEKDRDVRLSTRTSQSMPSFWTAWMNNSDIPCYDDDDEDLPPVSLTSLSTSSASQCRDVTMLEGKEPSLDVVQHLTMEQMLNTLSAKVSTSPVTILEVRRDFVLSDCIKATKRKNFNLMIRVKVRIFLLA